jgi:hypothetical protein
VCKSEILLVGVHHFYQWLEGSRPSPLEVEQRHRFTQRVQQVVQEFQPNVILDETPDTDNAALLAVLPAPPIPIDISGARKRERGFNVERSIHYLCPFVDAVLEESYIKRLAFPELLTNAGYRVRVVNLYKEGGFDQSWMEEWKHPVTEVTGINEAQCCVRSGKYQENEHCDRRIYWKERFAGGVS